MRKKKTNLYGVLANFLGSKWFFSVILVLFVGEAGWLALTNAFPMAFDESYHFGLIQFFSHHLNPIITQQPSSSYNLGNIVANPSWLYHYLLSFPYTLTAHLTDSLRTQVVALRFINIAMAVGTMMLLSRLLGLIHLHKGVRNIIICLFAFTPVVTVLSAQINYDNLVILSVVAAMYLTIVCGRQLLAGTVNIRTLLGLGVVCSFGSLVKYSFLPVFVGIVLYLGFIAIRRAKPTTLTVQSLRATNRVSLAALSVGALLGLSLFVGYYATNVVRYHNPVPQCEQVLTVADCSQYYAWNRNYELAQNIKQAPPTQNAFVYSYHWLVTMWYQLYAEIIPTGGIISITPLFYGALLILTALASIATLLQIRHILSDYPALIPIGVVVVSYVLLLWLRNYHDYRHLGQPVAVQGRYLVPILAYYYTVLVLGVRSALQAVPKPGRLHFAEMAMASMAVMLFVGYGGSVRYLSRVTPDHRWSQFEAVITSPTSKPKT